MLVDLSRLSVRAKVFLVSALVVFTTFALLRTVPVNATLRENSMQERGDADRNVSRIMRLAKAQAAKPFSEVRNHALFFDRNPALFMFTAELFARCGVQQPWPLQLLSIALWDVGLVTMFLWLLYLFDSELGAAAGVTLLLTTPFALFYSTSIHSEPYCVCFFNLALYGFTHYLQLAPQAAARRRWLVVTCIAYFVLCLNYWFYYVSAGLMLVALQLKARQFSLRTSAILAAVPVLAALVTFLQVAYALGGISNAAFRMADIAVARVMDARIPGSKWYPHRKFIMRRHWEHYPALVGSRIALLSGYSVWTQLGLLAAALALAGRNALERYRYLPVALLAGLSWNLIMIQHTVIHKFAAMYGFFMWSIPIGMLVTELSIRLTSQRARRIAAVLSVPVALYAFSTFYLPYASVYATNSWAPQGQAHGIVPMLTKKQRRLKKEAQAKAKESPAPEDEVDDPE